MMSSIFKDGAWERWGQDIVAVHKRLGKLHRTAGQCESSVVVVPVHPGGSHL